MITNENNLDLIAAYGNGIKNIDIKENLIAVSDRDVFRIDMDDDDYEDDDDDYEDDDDDYEDDDDYDDDDDDYDDDDDF